MINSSLHANVILQPGDSLRLTFDLDFSSSANGEREDQPVTKTSTTTTTDLPRAATTVPTTTTTTTGRYWLAVVLFPLFLFFLFFFFLEGLFICFLIYLSSCPTGHDMSSERRRDFPYSFISIGLISPFICFCFVFLSPFLLFFLSCCCCYRGIFNWHAHH